jgi:hypothetical protein
VVVAVNDARRLAHALADPASVAGLDADGWTALMAMARAEQLIGTLAMRVDGLPMPPAVKAIIVDARAAVEHGRRAALWEAEMARRALALARRSSRRVCRQGRGGRSAAMLARHLWTKWRKA